MRTLSLSALLLVLGAAGLVACGDKDDTAPPEGDTDTDADGDTDSDTDADVGACGAWTGIERVGSTWSYAFSDSGLEGTVDNEIVSYDSGTGLVSAESLSVLATVDYTITSTTTSEYRCDTEGMWMLAQYTEYSMDYSGTIYDGWTDSTYDPPALLMPNEITVGDTWTTAYVGITETSMSGPAPFESTVEQEVVEQSQVTVPAGTFETLYVEFSGDGSGYSHLASGVGQVKSNVVELLSFEP